MLAEQLNAVAKGDSNAFSDLFRQNQRRLISYASGLLAGDRDAAQDVVDEAMIAVWQHAGGYAGNGSAEGWLRRIVRNKAVDWLRRIHGGKQSAMGGEFAIADIADNTPGPEECAVRQSDADTLRQALCVLSAEQRHAVWLCYFEEMSLAEIAELCGCPQNTVKTRLFHARRILRGQKILERG